MLCQFSAVQYKYQIYKFARWYLPFYHFRWAEQFIIFALQAQIINCLLISSDKVSNITRLSIFVVNIKLLQSINHQPDYMFIETDFESYSIMRNGITRDCSVMRLDLEYDSKLICRVYQTCCLQRKDLESDIYQSINMTRSLVRRISNLTVYWETMSAGIAVWWG